MLNQISHNLVPRVSPVRDPGNEFESVIEYYCVRFISHKKKQRDQLFVWVQEQREELGPNYEDEELLQTEQCLDEVGRICEGGA